MTGRVVAAMLSWALVASLWAIFMWGGRVEACLGPLSVTPERCRAAMGLPPLTDIDRFMEGPGPWLVAIAVGWAMILLAARILGRRQRGGL